ncbi:MAG: hypothetical protein M3010_06035 [Candidatus Dormibacteraeota bacterium]|nr:hypothetical protein [Candidatus Dormibacteraeota bacterium]
MAQRTWCASAVLAAVVAALAVAPAADAFIYWGHFAYGKGVGRAALDGTQGKEDFVPAPPGTYAFSRGVAVDSNFLYWGTHGLNTTPSTSFAVPRIGRSPLSGASPTYSFTESPSQGVTGLAVSPTHLYWSGANQDTGDVGRTPVVGGQQFQEFSSVFGEPNPQPCGVASDGTYVYFANRGTSSIGRATLANFGTASQVIEGQWIQRPASAANAVHPCGVAVDDTYVYWGVYETSSNGTVSAGTTIGRALKSDGSGATDNFAGGGRRVTGLAIEGSFLYTSNWNDGVPGHGSIGRANLSNGAGDADFVQGLDAPYGVAADAGGPAAAPPNQSTGGNYINPPSVGCSGCGNGGGNPASSIPPDFSRVWGTHKTFAPASWFTPVYGVTKASTTPKGTVFNYILDKAGTVKIAIARSVGGRRVGKRCVAPTPKNAGRRTCRRLAPILP